MRDQIRRLKPMLTQYLTSLTIVSLSRCRSHFTTYIHGQLSNLGEKSCEAIALAAGIPPRNLQGFLAFYRWNEDLARQRLQHLVVRDHGLRRTRSASSTKRANVKKGDKTPGVKRPVVAARLEKPRTCHSSQYNLAYAAGDFHCLLERRLVSCPEDFVSTIAPAVRRQAFPTTWCIAPKWQIALELFRPRRATTVRHSTGSRSMRDTAGKPEFCGSGGTQAAFSWGEVPDDVHRLDP